MSSVELTVTVRGGKWGDWDEGELGEALLNANAPELVVQAWKSHADGRPTIVFTPTVALSQAVRDAFVRAGVSAAHVDGTTPEKVREAVLEAYERGDITVLTNCMILTEGVDLPKTACIVVARPTRSNVLYTQMIGRGVRRHPGKQDCLVLDLVGATEEHSLQTLSTLVGLPADLLDKGRRSVSEAAEEHERRQAELAARAAEERELVARQAALWKVAVSRLNWISISVYRDVWALPLGKDKEGNELGTLILSGVPDGNGNCNAWLVRPYEHPRLVKSHPDLGIVQATAEDLVRRTAHRFASREAGWRSRPVSDNQKQYLLKYGIPVRPGMTAGEASDRLTETFMALVIRKYRLVPDTALRQQDRAGRAGASDMPVPVRF